MKELERQNPKGPNPGEAAWLDPEEKPQDCRPVPASRGSGATEVLIPDEALRAMDEKILAEAKPGEIPVDEPVRIQCDWPGCEFHPKNNSIHGLKLHRNKKHGVPWGKC